jgi:hypothetical protein
MVRTWLLVLSLTGCAVLSACLDASDDAAPGDAGRSTRSDLFPAGSTGGNGGGTVGLADANTAMDGAQALAADAGPSDLPCDVAQVVTVCQDCHAATPRFGAPMPLVTAADFAAAAKSDPSRKVRDLAALRIHDEANPMPPSGLLPESDRAVLDAWLQSGAPAGDSACDAIDAGPAPTPVGEDALDCEVTHRFRAHATGSEGAFHVPESAGNLYQCFTFASPFDGTTQGTAWAPIIDDERVVHHWILFRTATAQTDGQVGPCKMPSDVTFVAGWAPGGENFVLPDDVGLELPGPGDSLILQLHYHNVAGLTDADDASGVALCTTDAPRTHDAGIFTLGTIGIDIPAGAVGHLESGMCGSLLTAGLPQPVHIIASFPHMHELGVSLRTDIMRGSNDGPIENVVDVPRFSFEDQRMYPIDPPIEFRARDAIRTTCKYDNPRDFAVRFGEKTEDEMCFNFMLLYPISMFTAGRSCLF